MPTFEYQAQAPDGHVVSGMVFGLTMDHALRDLSSKGMQIQRIGIATNPNDPLAAPADLAPTVPPSPTKSPGASVEGSAPSRSASTSVVAEQEPGGVTAGPPTEQRSYVATSVWGPLAGQVPLTAILFFFRQASTMFEAGVPPVQALETLAGQSGSAKLTGIIRELSGHVRAGRSLSAGLQRYPEVFSGIIVSLIRAGEEGGFLSDAMNLVASYLERDLELRNLYKRLTLSPKIQIAASIVIILVANFIIDSVGGKEHLSSPLTTAATWIVLTPLIVAGFLFFRVGLANPGVKRNYDEVVARLPYIGNTMRQISMAKFGRAFGALYKGGVPVQKSLLLSADACGNEFLRGRMYTAHRSLEEGAGITESFIATQAFSPIVIDMLNTGETTGNIDFMLNKMADYYEQEAAVRSTKTAQILSVVLFLIVAIYIGTIVIGFWSSYGASVSGGGG